MLDGEYQSLRAGLGIEAELLPGQALDTARYLLRRISQKPGQTSLDGYAGCG